jgi:hypothetical protein
LLPVKDMERVKNKALGGGTTLEWDFLEIWWNFTMFILF